MSNLSTVEALECTADALTPDGDLAFAALAVDAVEALDVGAYQMMEAWAPHRQREFTAGRLCARRALDRLAVGHAELHPDKDGVPQWPKGLLGSISHSRGVAIAVAARSTDCSLLGLDLEKTTRLSVAAIKRVVHPLEESFVRGDQLRASILFSLKEAFYKAQFPKWRIAANFHDLALEIDLVLGEANVLKMDERFATELERLRFRFRLVDDYVVSLCYLGS